MRALSLLALLALAGCSWDAETADIFVQVDGIPPEADHLDVTFTASANAGASTQYRPSFQPVDAGTAPRSVALSFKAPSNTGTFTLQIVAADRLCPSPCTSGLAAATQTANEPAAGATVNLEVTLK